MRSVDRRRRAAALAACGAAVAWLANCSELGGPSGGVYSISPLLLPSPSMVVGDTMRDSAGVAAPLRVVGFTESGDTVRGSAATFITLDTNAHLVAGTVLVADHVGGARVVGMLGGIQTLPETVKVTLSPDTIVATDSVRHRKTYSFLSGDTLVNSAELSTRVAHRDGTTLSDVDGVVVYYAIVSAPPAKGSTPPVVLMSGNLLSSRDTTVSGRAGRIVRLRAQQLTSLSPDSAIVTATASYRGQTIGVVQFTVVFTNQ